MNRCRASLDLFFAMWFVMGNVWIFDTRFGSFSRAPKLHILCITILAWNAITYSFPFFLFLLLCIFVPLASNFIGYNMSLGSAEKGASDDQISQLLSWKYKQVECSLEPGNSSSAKDIPVCYQIKSCSFHFFASTRIFPPLGHSHRMPREACGDTRASSTA